MTAWEGWTLDGAYGVRIQESVLRELDRMCRDAGSVETGGILVGRYSLDLKLAVVREATSPPSDSRGGRTWFNRGVAGLRELLAQRWWAKDRTHYLGEWHFHPVPIVVPSAEDFSQMVKIAHSADYKCREPLLVIVGATKFAEARAVRAFVCPAHGSPIELTTDRRDA